MGRIIETLLKMLYRGVHPVEDPSQKWPSARSGRRAGGPLGVADALQIDLHPGVLAAPRGCFE